MKRIYVTLLFILIPIILFADNIENLSCLPVPFSPFQNENLLKIRYSLRYESEVIINIFTLTGEIVYSKRYPKGAGDATAGIDRGTRIGIKWDGKNNDGRYVADGGYIVQIRAIPDSGKEEVKYVKILVIKDK